LDPLHPIGFIFFAIRNHQRAKKEGENNIISVIIKTIKIPYSRFLLKKR
jgi:hypothetical protein